MSNIIQLTAIDREPRADSVQIAEQLGVAHASTIKLVRRFLPDFEELGSIRFQIQVGRKDGRGGRSVEVALLNEDQCYLLLSYSRNTARVRGLKVRLVQAFGLARRAGVAESLTAWQELQALQLADADSLARASFGSHLMLDRKRELPGLRQRRLQLEQEFAPQLLAS